MKPPTISPEVSQHDLFRSELKQMIDLRHPLVKLAEGIDWSRFDEQFGPTYCEDNGRPGISTRLMVSLNYLKCTHDLSDEDVVRGWVENPYWQYLSGAKYFGHEMPIDPSSMTRWRKRIGESGAEAMLAETIEVGKRLGFVKASQLTRINVDTTVQEKHVRFPTDSRLYDRAREKLVKLAKKFGIRLRQNYGRVGKKILLMQSRYSHAKQFKRAKKCTRKLRTYLGRVIRDIERKAQSKSGELRELLEVSRQVYEQERKDKGKVYSVHAPEVECISKGKAHKRYEFGCKVSVAATSRGGWFVGAQALHGNPYDGHTLAGAMKQMMRVMGCEPEDVFADRGYRGHDYEGLSRIHVDCVRRGKIAQSLWRWMKRRSAVEPGIGHLKHGHRMDRNRLKGIEGDMFNAVLSAAGMNLSKLSKTLLDFLRPIIFGCFERVFEFWTSDFKLQKSTQLA